MSSRLAQWFSPVTRQKKIPQQSSAAVSATVIAFLMVTSSSLLSSVRTAAASITTSSTASAVGDWSATVVLSSSASSEAASDDVGRISSSTGTNASVTVRMAALSCSGSVVSIASVVVSKSGGMSNVTSSASRVAASSAVLVDAVIRITVNSKHLRRFLNWFSGAIRCAGLVMFTYRDEKARWKMRKQKPLKTFEAAQEYKHTLTP